MLWRMGMRRSGCWGENKDKLVEFKNSLYINEKYIKNLRLKMDEKGKFYVACDE